MKKQITEPFSYKITRHGDNGGVPQEIDPIFCPECGVDIGDGMPHKRGYNDISETSYVRHMEKDIIYFVKTCKCGHCACEFEYRVTPLMDDERPSWLRIIGFGSLWLIIGIVLQVLCEFCGLGLLFRILSVVSMGFGGLYLCGMYAVREGFYSMEEVIGLTDEELADKYPLR